MLMVRGECLPVRGSGTIKWKYYDDLCGCGQVETEEHVECNRYEQERERWKGKIKRLKDGICEYEVIKGYNVESDGIERETMWYLRVLWNSGHRYERLRVLWNSGQRYERLRVLWNSGQRYERLRVLWIGFILTVRMIMMKLKR